MYASTRGKPRGFGSSAHYGNSLVTVFARLATLGHGGHITSKPDGAGKRNKVLSKHIQWPPLRKCFYHLVDSPKTTSANLACTSLDGAAGSVLHHSIFICHYHVHSRVHTLVRASFNHLSLRCNFSMCQFRASNEISVRQKCGKIYFIISRLLKIHGILWTRNCENQNILLYRRFPYTEVRYINV